MYSRVTRTVAGIGISHGSYSTVGVCSLLCIHSSADGSLGCFRLWAIVSNAVMDFTNKHLFKLLFKNFFSALIILCFPLKNKLADFF